MFTDTYLYGFGHLNEAISYRRIPKEVLSVSTIKRVAQQMLDWNPGIEAIYAMNDRIGLKQDYMESHKSKDFVENLAFRDICEREGLLVFFEE